MSEKIFTSTNEEQREAHEKLTLEKIESFAARLPEEERIKVEALQEASNILRKHKVIFLLFGEAGGAIIDFNKLVYGLMTNETDTTKQGFFLEAATKKAMMLYTKCFVGKSFTCFDEQGNVEYDIVDGEAVPHQEE